MKNCEFIDKLNTMLEDKLDFIKWSEDGSQVIINRLDKIPDTKLLEYFRHNNFSSFVRQLNMYGFCKKEKTCSSMTFQHPIFRRGNSENFQKIVRKTKTRALKKSQLNFKTSHSSLLSKLHSDQGLSQPFRQASLEMFMYHGLIHEAMKSIKLDLSLLGSELKGARSVRVNDSLAEIKGIVDGPLSASLSKYINVESDLASYEKLENRGEEEYEVSLEQRLEPEEQGEIELVEREQEDELRFESDKILELNQFQ